MLRRLVAFLAITVSSGVFSGATALAGPTPPKSTDKAPASPPPEAGFRPRIPTSVTGDASLGLVQNRLLIIVTGAAATQLDATMTAARMVPTKATSPDPLALKAPGQWRKGKNLGCRVAGGAAECRLEVTRTGQVLAPATWVDTEPSGTFSRLLEAPTGTITVTPGPAGAFVELDGRISTAIALWLHRAKSPLTCESDAAIGSQLTFACSTQVDRSGLIRRPTAQPQPQIPEQFLDK